jgi:sugar phosphate isomerase/epimerase
MAASRPTVRTGLSLAGFRSADEVKRFQEAARAALGPEPYFELSYTLGEGFLRGLGFLKDSVLSVHAPCPADEFFPNLGSRDPGVRRESIEMIRRSAGTAAGFGAGRVVVHPGYACDSRVPVDPGRRLAALKPVADREQRGLIASEGSISGRGYCESAVYRAHLQAAIDGLGAATAVCKGEGIALAVENLNPRITYLFQLPSELAALAGALPGIGVCADVGHLWISSLAHGFAFSDGLTRILATGRVIAAHIHDNASRLGPPPVFSDDHALIGSGNVPIESGLRLLLEARVADLILETTTVPLENLRRLSALL